MIKPVFRILAVMAMLSLAACSADQKGDSNAGEKLYNTFLNTKPRSHTCANCHSLDGTERYAPTFKGLSERAAERIEGMTAEEYLRQSIVDPEALVVGEFLLPMPLDYADLLTEEQISDLIAFILTQ